MAEDFSYLSKMSDRAQKLIIDRVAEGKTNLYQSIMAILGSRMKNGELSDLETEMEYYKNRNRGKIADIDELLFDEIFEYIYYKFQANRLRDNGSPIASKDERLIAKGAMIMALERCGVSDKNIQGMLGVMNQLLLTRSAFDLKKTYQEYSKCH